MGLVMYQTQPDVVNMTAATVRTNDQLLENGDQMGQIRPKLFSPVASRRTSLKHRVVNADP